MILFVFIIKMLFFFSNQYDKHDQRITVKNIFLNIAINRV